MAPVAATDFSTFMGELRALSLGPVLSVAPSPATPAQERCRRPPKHLFQEKQHPAPGWGHVRRRRNSEFRASRAHLLEPFNGRSAYAPMSRDRMLGLQLLTLI